jgi:hypothetical protein
MSISTVIPQCVRQSRTAVCLTLVVFLSGCQPPSIDVSTTVHDGTITAYLEQRWGLFWWLSTPKTPCVDRLELVELLPAGEQKVRWQAWTADTVQCLDLSKFTVGVPPKGFHEKVRLTPMPPKTRVKLIVRGIGDGEVTFFL